MSVESDLKAIKKALRFILTNERDNLMEISRIRIRNESSTFENPDNVSARIEKSKERIRKTYEPILRELAK